MHGVHAEMIPDTFDMIQRINSMLFRSQKVGRVFVGAGKVQGVRLSSVTADSIKTDKQEHICTGDNQATL